MPIKDAIGERLFDHMMIVELKVNGASPRPAQDETFALMNAVMCKATHNGRGRTAVKVFLNGEMRLVKHYGTHVWRLSGTTPDNSETMWWDGKVITTEEVIELLLFERDPERPDRKIGRALGRHHAKPPWIKNQIPLFEKTA